VERVANIAAIPKRIVSLGAIQQQFSNRWARARLEVYPFIQNPGLPVGAIWGYQTDGIFKEAQRSTPTGASSSTLDGVTSASGSERGRH